MNYYKVISFTLLAGISEKMIALAVL